MTELDAVGIDAQSEPLRADNLIASDKVEGTNIHIAGSGIVGAIRRLIIDKPSGRIVYAIIRLADTSEMPEKERAVPWKVLYYNTEIRAYEINSTHDKLRSGPTYPENTSDPTFDPAWDEHVHSYFNSEPYWNSETDRATDVPFGKKK
jgi:hypothetical protein